ncbi:hypothetical protein KC727_00555 [Candidatus Kaiserbacteria bacterium]|nr:hypothetical protein [Candidatus Kaiserbacteria bacterium]
MDNPVTVVGLDFDGTIVDTFNPPPGGMGVSEAYKQTIQDIFGDGALDKLGGFRNQAPVELSKLLRDVLGAERFASRAQQYHTVHRKALDAVMPEEVGAKIDWRAESVIAAVAEVIVRRKLELLFPNIGIDLGDGNRWPQLMPGFKRFWVDLQNRRELLPAILSSGHDVFIRRVFELHELLPPEIIISDDRMRQNDLCLYKPNMRLWEMVLSAVRDLGYLPVDSVYAGDSREHDGGLARNAGIPFVQFAGWESVWHGHRGSIDNWEKFPNIP